MNHPKPYKITYGLRVEEVEFTESSKNSVILPTAVKFAAKKNAILQSAREAGAYRIQAHKKSFESYFDASHQQATRTAAVYFKHNSKAYVAIDDIPDAQKNIILARVQQCYAANKKGREWILPTKDKHIAQILKRAEKSSRVLEVTHSPVNGSLGLATRPCGYMERFGDDAIVQALLGDVAKQYEQMLSENKRNYGFVHVYTPEKLEQLVDAKHAIVVPVSLSGGYNDQIVASHSYEEYDGYACGVYNPQEWKR